MSEPRIVECWMEEEAAIVEGVPSGRLQVIALLDDDNDEEVKLFSYYTDELTFTPNEFDGMTVTEARQLFFRRDMEYLKSP